VASIFLHAKQEAVQDRIVGRLQAVLRENMLIRVEKRARRRRVWLTSQAMGGMRRGLRASNNIIECFNSYVESVVQVFTRK
jgi:hypothetical protein